jgi:hypothetical protein
VEATSTYDAYRTFDHGFHIRNRLARKLTETERERFDSLRRYEELWIASSTEFMRVLKELDLLDDEAEDAVKDYEFFLKRRTLRRPDIWLKERSIAP